jgi:hypothetical protein
MTLMKAPALVLAHEDLDFKSCLSAELSDSSDKILCVKRIFIS